MAKGNPAASTALKFAGIRFPDLVSLPLNPTALVVRL